MFSVARTVSSFNESSIESIKFWTKETWASLNSFAYGLSAWKYNTEDVRDAFLTGSSIMSNELFDH